MLIKVTKQPKHGVTNPQNKTDKCSGVASGRFKSHAIEMHRKSGRHKSALRKFVEEKETEISVLKKAFSAAYFLMKEHLPNRKFLPLIEFYNKCDRSG